MSRTKTAAPKLISRESKIARQITLQSGFSSQAQSLRYPRSVANTALAIASLRPSMSLRRRTLAPKPASKSPSIDKSSDYVDVFCEECGFGHSPAKLVLCDKCDRGYHLFCLRPILVAVPKGSWFCPSCSKNKKPKCMFPVSVKIYVERYLY